MFEDKPFIPYPAEVPTEQHHTQCNHSCPETVEVDRRTHEIIHQANADAVFEATGLKSNGFCGDPFTLKLGNNFYKGE